LRDAGFTVGLGGVGGTRVTKEDRQPRFFIRKEQGTYVLFAAVVCIPQFAV
jgi:hypothetical protein